MTDPDRILDGLNQAQAEAARTVRGPVVILAGAGSGKTTTITRRIAYQVATRTFDAKAILAVAFTRKARTEMKRRLQTFGIEGVSVLTIHGAAYAQLGMFHRAAGTSLPEVLNEGQKQELMTWGVFLRAGPGNWLDRQGLGSAAVASINATRGEYQIRMVSGNGVNDVVVANGVCSCINRGGANTMEFGGIGGELQLTVNGVVARTVADSQDARGNGYGVFVTGAMGGPFGALTMTYFAAK